MNIGEASKNTDLPVKTIRYYEDIKLLKPNRSQNGYRDYSDNDVHRLRFLQRSRGLGFSIEDCRKLLSLYDDSHRASADVKAIALKHIRQIDTKLAELNSLRETLNALVDHCHGDNRPDCPIIDDLSGKVDR